ncbi:hypothetical protein ACFX2I_000149 [Malus domestica]
MKKLEVFQRERINRGGGEVSHGDDLDLIPSDTVLQAHDKVVAFVHLIELLMETTKPVVKLVKSRPAAVVDVRTVEHVEIGDLEEAIIDYLKRSAELVLEHFEFGFGVDKGAGFGLANW